MTIINGVIVMKLKIIASTLFILTLLIGCSSGDNTAEPSTKKEDINIKELVETYSVGHFTDETASITAEELIITDEDGNESVYDLPEDEFFVSIAPFITETHPCTNHSLTGCQGELDHKDFDVYIEDTAGNVVLDDTLNSEDNGFIDLWLPRDKNFRVKVTHDGKEVESDISTFENDGTCITTMQLS